MKKGPHAPLFQRHEKPIGYREIAVLLSKCVRFNVVDANVTKEVHGGQVPHHPLGRYGLDVEHRAEKKSS